MPSLEEIRTRIDALDEQIQALINERAGLALAIAELKGNEEEAVYHRPEREAQVLRKVLARQQGPLEKEAIAQIFREIISACLALQRPLQVAYLGPPGTFTQAAVFKHFGHAHATCPLGTIEAVFREVESGAAHYGVVPVENSTEGVVTHTLDRFVHSPLKICGEVQLRIHLHLLGKAEGKENIRRIYAHQQALGQCRAWLATHLASVETVSVSSNAEAARLASQEEGAGAIAGVMAAEQYGLRIIEANIEDEPGNTTRFLVIGSQDTEPSGDDKTSLLLSTHNRPGALHRLLEPLAERGITLTRIESRPSRQGLWDYVFFIDVLGHAKEEKL
ncbi:MAG: prephenate dehydratase, partial [Gammaproteobacteria bacterium]